MIKNPITPAFKELRKLGYEAHQGVRINEARILSMLCDKLVFYLFLPKSHTFQMECVLRF